VTDVTEQQTAERELDERTRELREETAFVETILDNQRDIVYAVDTDGRLTRWNDRLVEVTGYDDEAVAGMQARELLADEATRRVENAIEAAVEERESVTLELRLVTADGTEIPYEFTSNPILDDGKVVGIVGVGRDITARKEKQRQLTRHRDDLESELEEIYGRITDAFFALDEDWTFTHFNERAQELVDPDGDGLEGENIWESFPDAVDSRFEAEYRTAMESQEPTTFEAYYPSRWTRGSRSTPTPRRPDCRCTSVTSPTGRNTSRSSNCTRPSSRPSTTASTSSTVTSASRR